jgi:Mg2+ and Co2+ transporter CorA
MEIFWLREGRIERRAAEEVAEKLLANVFHFHALELRDCRERNHIAKLHPSPEHLFVIVHAPELGAAGQVHLIELDYFAGQRYLVTVHGPVNPLVSEDSMLRETRAALRRIEAGRLTPRTAAELSHAIVSGMAARQDALVNELTRKVAELERMVLSGERRAPESALEEMFRVRHELLTVRTMAAGSREVYARMQGLSRFLPPEAQPFIADLVDQFERVRSSCDSEMAFLQGVVDFWQSRTAVKMNVAMERLTLISAVILPLTLIAGIYGMNIIVPDHTSLMHVSGVLVVMSVVGVAVFQWARRQGWW